MPPLRNIAVVGLRKLTPSPDHCRPDDVSWRAVPGRGLAYRCASFEPPPAAPTRRSAPPPAPTPGDRQTGKGDRLPAGEQRGPVANLETRRDGRRRNPGRAALTAPCSIPRAGRNDRRLGDRAEGLLLPLSRESVSSCPATMTHFYWLITLLQLQDTAA